MKKIKHLWKRFKHWLCSAGLCNLDKCKCRCHCKGRSAAWNECSKDDKLNPPKMRPTIIPKDSTMIKCIGEQGANLPRDRNKNMCGKMIKVNTQKCPHCGTVRKIPLI